MTGVQLPAVPRTGGASGSADRGRATYWKCQAVPCRDLVAGSGEDEQVLAVGVGAAGNTAPGGIGSRVWALGCGVGLGTAAPQGRLRRTGGPRRSM